MKMVKTMIRTRFGDVTYKPEDIKNYGRFSPSEVSKIVNISLMVKPNKGVVFSSFTNYLHNQTEFIIFTIANSANLTIDALQAIINLCTSKIESAKSEEIAKLEQDIKDKQKKIEELKLKK